MNGMNFTGDPERNPGDFGQSQAIKLTRYLLSIRHVTTAITHE